MPRKAVTPTPPAAPAADGLADLPGHAIRRLQQIAVGVFMQEAEPQGLTPVQYAALQVVCRSPGMDQRTLAAAIGLDTSTTAGVVDRLEARGVLKRNASEIDRRVRLLTPTEAGRSLLREVEPAVARAQERMLAPLTASERAEFMRMLLVLVNGNQALDGTAAAD